MMMATISEIKNHLSAYLKKVYAGETVLILDRNRPVARIERINAQEQPEGRLARLELQGLVQRSAKPVPMDILRTSPPCPKQSVLQALLEERQEGR
jgi:prevent-host-death family protein